MKNGTKLVLADPRRSELARHAVRYLQFKPDSDVAMLNAMMHTIVEEGLVAETFVNDRTSGFAEMRDNVARFSPRRWRRCAASMQPRSARSRACSRNRARR